MVTCRFRQIRTMSNLMTPAPQCDCSTTYIANNSRMFTQCIIWNLDDFCCTRAKKIRSSFRIRDRIAGVWILISDGVFFVLPTRWQRKSDCVPAPPPMNIQIVCRCLHSHEAFRTRITAADQIEVFAAFLCSHVWRLACVGLCIFSRKCQTNIQVELWAGICQARELCDSTPGMRLRNRNRLVALDCRISEDPKPNQMKYIFHLTSANYIQFTVSIVLHITDFFLLLKLMS